MRTEKTESQRGRGQSSFYYTRSHCSRDWSVTSVSLRAELIVQLFQSLVPHPVGRPKIRNIQEVRKNMQNTRKFVCLIAALAAIAATLSACGSSATHPTKYIAVADSDNSRILLYPVPVTTGQAATIVLGQADFTSSSGATS